MDNGEFKAAPKEFDTPPKEYKIPPEFYEYTESGGESRAKKKKKKSSFLSLIRTNAIMPVAAAIASVSVIASALGSNLFGAIGISGSGSGSSPAASPVDSYILVEYELPSAEGYFDGTNIVTTLLYAEDGVTVTDGLGNTVPVGKVDGATYDKSTNTLHLNDVFCDYILLSGLGNVTVSVSGTSGNIGRIEAKGGGYECGIALVPESASESPVLTLSPRSPGFPCITIYASGSDSRLFFGRGLSVFLYSDTAVAVYGSGVSDAVKFESELLLSLGKISKKSDSGLYDVTLECTGGKYDPVSVESK